MTEHERPVSQEPLTEAQLHFGLVVGIPYHDGLIPSVVLEKIPDYDAALTSRIHSDIEGQEHLAQPGTSPIKIIQRLNMADMTREQLVRGFIACFDGHFPRSQIENMVDNHIAKWTENKND